MSDAAHPDEKDKALSRLGGEILTLQRALRAHMQKYRDPNPSLINLLGDDSADWKDYEPPSPLERDREVIEAVYEAQRQRGGAIDDQLPSRIADILAGRTPEEGAKLRGEVVEPPSEHVPTDRELQQFKDPDQIAAEAFGVAKDRSTGVTYDPVKASRGEEPWGDRAAGVPVVAGHDEHAAMRDEDVVEF